MVVLTWPFVEPPREIFLGYSGFACVWVAPSSVAQLHHFQVHTWEFKVLSAGFALLPAISLPLQGFAVWVSVAACAVHARQLPLKLEAWCRTVGSWITMLLACPLPRLPQNDQIHSAAFATLFFRAIGLSRD